jgi:hypothetical protein
MKRTTLSLLVVTGLLLAACAGSGATTTFEGATGSDTTPETNAAGRPGFESTDGDPTGVPQVTDRKVVYNGRLQLQAAQTRGAFNEIVRLVEAAGGYVASTSIGEASGNTQQPVINLVIRLPADRLTATLEGIRAAADKVVAEALNSQDVTEEYTDIEAQLRNLQVLETELLGLLTDLRDNPDADPSKLLEVFAEIRSTRGEIERLQGRRQLLDNLVALATVEISISPLPAAAPISPEPGWEPAAVAKQALRDTVASLQNIGDFLIRLGLNVLPLLIIVFGPIALIAWLVWRRVRRPVSGSPAPGDAATPH